ncbi:MAG TPA: ATP-binding protein [Longimicrobiales bacterium]
MYATKRDPLLVVVRAGLLLIGLLAPLNVPFSIPPVADATFFGWDSGPVAGAGAAPAVMHTMRHAFTRGLRTGDVIVRIEGRPADAATIRQVRERVAPGDTVELLVARGADTLAIAIPVQRNSASYSGYFAYRVALALLCWAIGMALITWRGDRPRALALGAALLLLAPITLPSGVPGEGRILRAAQYGWQLQAAAHRFLFPALAFAFLASYLSEPAWLRNVGVRWGLCGAIALGFAVATDAFRSPMAWAPLGPTREFRTVAGLVFELPALAAAVALYRRESSRGSTSVRWIAFALLLVLATAALRSISILVVGEADVHEFVWRLEGLALILLPAVGVLYFADADYATTAGWHKRRLTAASVSAVLTALYGVAIAGSAAIVLSSTGHSLGGVEWLLFAAIFASSLVFSPVLRWARELVDRRMFARWAELEQKVHRFVDRVGAEARPERIARRVAEEVPELLDVSSATLLVAEDIAGTTAHGSPELVVRSTAEIHEELKRRRTAGEIVLPILRPGGELLGALRLTRRELRHPVEPPEAAILRMLTQGIAAALRNAETYRALLRAQQELAESERIAALGTLAGGLAHEIKNPLAGLKMGLHLLSREGVPASRIERIAREVRRIDDLVSGLLRYTHDSVSERLEPIDVREVARDCVEDARILAEDRAITIVERYAAEPSVVLAGCNQLRIILSNLLANAIAISPEGAAVDVDAWPDGDTVEIRVRDRGPGLPAGAHERIFELGYTARPGGTGLGLALARRETERLGGSIRAAPGDAGGTILRVSLPRATVPSVP